jgi:ssDNA-binding replication factor A large subunit
MGAIEDVHEDLDADVSLEEFREAVEEKVEQMGGLADEESAAMLVAHEYDESGGAVGEVAEIEPGMDDAEFTAKVVGVGDLRTFERDGEDAEDGKVLNVEVADESGSVRTSFWDESAEQVAEGMLEPGDVVRLKGRPQEGLSGVEVSVDNARLEDDVEIDVHLQDTYRVEDLSLGLSDVDLVGELLATDEVRTFDRDDGSTGKVSNLVVGDETGRVRVTLWDDMADRAEELSAGPVVEVVDGYVRERDGDLELHVGERGAVETVDEDVEYVPESTPIEALEIGDTADVAGVVRSVDEKRTFERDDGSEGQVRNVRVQDDTGDVRVALWGEKADTDVGPGDELHLADVSVEDGWQDDIEASANWRSTVTVLGGEDDDPGGETLDSFGDGDAGGTAGPGDGGGGSDEAGAGSPTADTGTDGGTAAVDAPDPSTPEDGDPVEFTGTVVQAGDPVVLDDGERTVSVETDADVTLGEELTVRGTFRDGRVDPDELV